MKKLNKALFAIAFGIFVAGGVSASIGEYWSTISHLIPRTDSTVDIGSNDKKVRAIWTDAFYGDYWISGTGNSMNVQPTGDTDDFFSFKTPADRPTIKREGGKYIYIESSNVNDVGISFRKDADHSGTVNYYKDTNEFGLTSKDPLVFKISEDYDDYIKIVTASGIPEMLTVGAADFKINAGGANNLLLNHSGGNVGIGDATPAALLTVGDGDVFQVSSTGVVTFTGTGDIDLPANSVDEADLKAVNAPTDEYVLTYEATTGDFEWQVDQTGAGGSAITFDIGDDGGNDSVDVNEIATTGDTNTIFTEPTADKILIAVGNNWPTADTATTASALVANPTDCGANQFAQSIVANGNLTCSAIGDADVPNDITIDLATLASTVTNATFTTALTVDTGTVGLTGNIANTSVLTLGAGASSISGANTGDQDISGYMQDTDIDTFAELQSWAVGYTDNNTTYVSSDFTHDDLTGFVANEHIDWTADQGATNIHSGNYTAGLTNLTDFDQTAWRLFYSNNLGDVIELSLGTDGQYLQSQGGTSTLTWGTPGGAGDITSVFDCATGDCNTMTVGTSEYLTYGTGYIDANRFAGVTTVNATEFGYLNGLTAAIVQTGSASHDGFSDFVANEHLDWTADLGATNIHAGNYTDTNTTYVSSDWTLSDITGYVANEHINWTADQGATNIHSGNYTDTNTTYTAGTGLTLTTGAFGVNTSQNIATLSNLTTNGFITTSGGIGTLGIDTNTYLTGNQTITLSGDVTGSGETALTVTVSNDKILESHLKSVNAPTDEYCLTYEATTGDFEWQTCSAGAGDITAVFDCADGDCNTMTVGTSEYLTYGTGYIDANRFLGVTTVDSSEFGYLNGVTSLIQTQINGKQSTLTNSAGLLAALSDETGTGVSVFSTSPTFTTPLLGTPTSGVLTNCTGLPTAGLVDNAVTLAKMAHGTDGNLITYDADGAPAAVATGDADQVLTSNGVGAAPTFQAAAGGAGDVGGLYGINVETLSADKTLTVDSNKIYQYLDVGGVDRIVTLATAGASVGDRFVIKNTDSVSELYDEIAVKQGTTPKDFIYPQGMKEFIFDGTNWIAADYQANISIGYWSEAKNNSVAIGSSAEGKTYGVGVGSAATALNYGVGIGASVLAYSYGVAIGYYANTNNKRYSVALGYHSKNQRTSEIAYCIDGSSTQDYNMSSAGWAIQTANATPVEMFLGEESGQRFTINPESAVNFVIRIAARDNVANEVASYKIEGLIKRDGAGNTVLSWSNKTVQYEDDASWDVAVTADDTNEALIITVTGDGTNPVRFAGRIDEVETQF